MTNNTTRWCQQDTDKLQELFKQRADRDGISPTDLNKKALQRAIAKHWPEQQYATTANLIRKKARAWNLDKQLSGARRQSSKYSAYLFFFKIIFL